MKYYDGQQRVYWNLHRKCYSVQVYRRGIGWRLDRHCANIIINEAYGKVSEAVRLRVVAQKRKNVHAYLCGSLDFNTPLDQYKHSGTAVRYNPYKYTEFMVGDDTLNNCDNPTIYCTINSDGRPVMNVI